MDEKDAFHAWYESEFPLSAQAVKAALADEDTQDAYDCALMGWLARAAINQAKDQ